VTASVALNQVAEVNPGTAIGALLATDAVDFFPMAAVDADKTVARTSERRALGQVSKGFTNFRDGDVLLAKITPCFENGKIAQAVVTTGAAFGSTEFHVVRCSAELDGRYLVHFLRRPEIRVDGQRKMTGSGGQRRVPKHFLESLEIPLPPLPEQRRIAAILDKADVLRTKRREALAHLDRLAQSFFVEMFGDPVTNPMGWEVVKLGSVGSLDRGVSKHRPRNDPKLLGGRYPLIQTGDVANSGGYIREFQSTYSDFGLHQSKLWPRGTLCITIAANIAKTGILTFDACFPDSVVGFKSSEESTVEYVRVWLSFLQKTLEENAPESAQKNINLAILRDLDIPLPPAQMRERFARVIQSANALSGKMQEAAARLDVARSSLQQRAFRGEL
jgi:type I restriction enzyme S subunit